MGLDAVENAVNMGAVEKLVVADTALRDADEPQRLKLETLMREVEKRRANVTVVSTEHEAGAKLLSLGGIAALLRFPLYRDDTARNSLVKFILVQKSCTKCLNLWFNCSVYTVRALYTDALYTPFVT